VGHQKTSPIAVVSLDPRLEALIAFDRAKKEENACSLGTSFFKGFQGYHFLSDGVEASNKNDF